MKKNITIRKKLYSLGAIVTTLFISLQIVLFVYSKNVKENWDKYNNIVETKLVLLSKINNDFGYGGAIHNFKNYLIRGNKENYDQFSIKYKQFLNHKNDYLQLEQVTKFELEKLKKIESTFEKYRENINLIKTLKEEKRSISFIDNIIKIDDTEAIVAMNDIQLYFSKIRENTSNKIHDNIYYIYYISFIIVLFVLVLMLYLSEFFEKSILKPMIQIESGLESFFRFLSNKKYELTPIDVVKNDEFGIMANSINKNIVVATNLHNNIRIKNNELNGLIHSYGKNIIASKTDLKGIITYVSDAFAEISGYKKEELIGKSHNIVRHSDMEASVFEEMWKTIKDGKIWEGEIKNISKNGNYYLVKATISPMYDDDCELVGYSAIRQDITDQRQVEALNEQLDVYKNHLEEKVKKATRQIEELMFEIEDTQKEVVFTMGAIGERRSEETSNHVKRVAEYSKLLALYLGIEEKDAEMLKQASPMHDIGKVGISDSILNKKGKLTPEEFTAMKEHSLLGYNMLKSSKRKLLKTAAIVSYEHHEKYNGTGYPRGLKADEIHIYGRITAVADVFDALGSNRVYKKAWSDEKILNYFREERGGHFDPKIVDIFFEHIDKFFEIRNKFSDNPDTLIS